MSRNRANNQVHSEDNNKKTDGLFGRYCRAAAEVGAGVAEVLKKLYEAECRFSARIREKLSPTVRKGFRKSARVLRRWKKAFLHPVRMLVHGVVLIRKNAALAKEESRSVSAAVLKTVRDGARHNRWFFKGLFNYGAAVFGVAVVVAAVSVMTNLDLAVAVEYNGQSLGYIADETVYEEASKMLQERIVYEDSDTQIDTSPNLSLAVVSNSRLVDEQALVDDMIKSSSSDIVESNGIYIDGTFYGAVTDVKPIEDAVAAILKPYDTGKAGETVELVKPVEVRSGLYMTGTVVDPQEIVELLQSEVAGEVTYTVQEGETPSGVAKKNGISYSEFKALNPKCEEKFMIGQTVYIAKSEPFMPVKVTRRETYKQETMYETETVSDKKKSISYSKVTQKGVKGVTEITADVSYVNGVEVERDIVSKKVLQKVVNQKIVKGTRKPSGASSDRINSTGSGSISGLKFMWPVNGGYVSSPYGGRRNHKGVDIAAPRGTATYAAEDGVVTLSRYNGSYGYCIIIDHGNGVQTLYGHASKLIAKVGQKVKKGDVISLVGTTGRSTGNHCHFEIRRNGNRINPLPYIR